ncbi:MAG TPA: helix-turn-helix domain-containing protein [Blastocatellia bacterium]|nr:helix-turn-helix domain-containing protein [Blastocatellia bacterium]
MQLEKLFSTTEVARMWNVSESTVKRWADSGDLVCIKTRGGHRRFSLDEISQFQRKQGFDAAGSIASSEGGSSEPASEELERALARPSLPDLARLVERRALEGDSTGLRAILARAYLRGVTPVDLFELVVAEAMHSTGEQWMRGELTVADEHVATRTTVDAMTRLVPELIRKPSNGRTAVVGCPEEELYEVASRSIASLLELEGWRVIALGMNTPFFSFRDAIAKYLPHLVCISSTLMIDIERHAREYNGLYESAEACGARVAIGGAGFQDPAVRARFRHDRYCETFHDLVRYAALA